MTIFSLFFFSSATAPVFGWGGMPVEMNPEPLFFLGLKTQKGVVVGVRDSLPSRFKFAEFAFILRELKGQAMTGDCGRDMK